MVFINLETFRPYWTIESGEKLELREAPLFECTINKIYHNKGPPSYEEAIPSNKGLLYILRNLLLARKFKCQINEK